MIVTERRYCIYTKKCNNKPMFSLFIQVQTGCHLPDADLVSHLKKKICPLVAGVCAVPSLRVASRISIALMAKEKKHSLAYLECINNKPSGGSMSLEVINKTFALALITAAAPW